MKHQATSDLFTYWNRLRGTRSAPERNEVDPAAIRHVLADTFMLDVDVDHRFQVRLAGTRVNALFDAEQKGRSFLKLWRPEEARNIAAVLLTVADGVCPVVAGAAAAPAGHAECPFELMFLPMRHHGKTHSRILGIIKTVGNPAWLGMLPIGALELRSLRIVEGDELAFGTRQSQTIAPQPVSLPMSNAAIRAAVDKATGRPRLRVIEGGGADTRLAASPRGGRSKVFEVEVENGHL